MAQSTLLKQKSVKKMAKISPTFNKMVNSFSVLHQSVEDGMATLKRQKCILKRSILNEVATFKLSPERWTEKSLKNENENE
jgi:hypothetical protein